MSTYRVRSLSLYAFLSLIHLSIATAFSPIDHYLVNCGSDEPVTVDVDNRRFTGDAPGSGSHFEFSGGSFSLVDINPSLSASPIYDIARVFKKPSKYKFKIRDKGTHLVRLHFRKFKSEIFNFDDSQFHVSANGFVLLNNFSAQETPIVKDYMIWVDSDELVITFTPSGSSKFAVVSAIEVISAPKDLIADVATFVSADKVEEINGLMKKALETVYRVNVGGPKVTPFNDSLWRNWVPDDEFLKLSDGSERVHFSGRIKYQVGGASREVGPDNVYNSARVIRSSSDSIPVSKISWEFNVVGGYKYLIRMHFCDIASISSGMLYFNVYINGKLAYENLDLSAMTNGVLASPFYADFVVDEENSGVPNLLTVSIGPSNESFPRAVDGILNGVEIMKMNNPMGSLDGEVCAGSLSRSWRRSNGGAFLTLTAAVCLLVMAFLVVQKRQAGLKDSVAWSRLPVDISEVDMKCSTRPFSGKV